MIVTGAAEPGSQTAVWYSPERVWSPRHIERTPHRVVTTSAAVSLSNDKDVEALLVASDVDAVHEAMAALQHRLRAHDYELALELNNVARGYVVDAKIGTDERGLAVQVLAGARVRALVALAFKLILDLCSENNEHIQASAIAAATHLPMAKKRELRPVAYRLSVRGGGDASRAAAAFLATI